MLVKLIRHGESEWVKTAKASPIPLFGGRMNDVPLTAEGWRQAEELGGHLKAHGLAGVRFVTSPAVRAVQTHRGAQRGMGRKNNPLGAMHVTDLQELTWGHWEGGPRSVANDPKWVRQRAEEGFRFRSPGGESYVDVRARALAALWQVVRSMPHGTTIVAYTHQNVIKSLVYPAMGWTPQQAMGAHLHVCGITTLRFGSRAFEVVDFDRPTLV